MAYQSEHTALASANAREALTRILAAHETWFDVQRNYEYHGRVFSGYAEFHSHGEQYVLVKRAKLWEVDAYEYIFFEVVGCLEETYFNELVEFVTTEALEKVHPDPNHMTSYLSLVIIVDEVDAVLAKKVRKTHFRKNFMLGFRGWADLRVAVVCMQSQQVITNSAGGEMKKVLQANIKPAEPKK